VLAETRARIAASAVETAEDVRAAAGPLAGFSEALAAQERTLKAFLYARMYNAPGVVAVRGEAHKVVTGLAAAYRAQPSLLPPEWRPESDDAVAVLRRISDFIAGMTDRFAIRQHRELVGPVELPEGF